MNKNEKNADEKLLIEFLLLDLLVILIGIFMIYWGDLGLWIKTGTFLVTGGLIVMVCLVSKNCNRINNEESEKFYVNS